MIRYQPTGRTNWLMSPLRDLSSGGARFLSEHVFNAGDIFEMQLMLPNSTQPVQLKARIAWIKPWRGTLMEVGVTFNPGDAGIQRVLDEAIGRLIDRKPI